MISSFRRFRTGYCHDPGFIFLPEGCRLSRPGSALERPFKSGGTVPFSNTANMLRGAFEMLRYCFIFKTPVSFEENSGALENTRGMSPLCDDCIEQAFFFRGERNGVFFHIFIVTHRFIYATEFIGLYTIESITR